MQSRQQDDNAEGLWRVHDTLYDLTEFINWHPVIKIDQMNKENLIKFYKFNLYI